MAITKASSSAVAPAAKGELVVGSATNDSAILAVGANATVLTADSTEATGMKWATVASGGMTLLTTGSMASTTSLTISSISQSYKDLIIDISYFNPTSTSSVTFGVRPNNSTSNYYGWTQQNGVNTYGAEDTIRISTSLSSDGGYAGFSRARIHIFDYTYSQTNGKIGGRCTASNQ